MNKTKIIRVFAVSLAISVSMAFIAKAPAETGVTDKIIKIGTSLPMTGPSAATGLAIERGTRALFNRINAEGGVAGKKLELVVLDDGYEPNRTLESYNKLVNEEKVFALLTLFGSPNTQAIMPKLEKDDVPLIGPIVSANITDPPKKNIFMLRANGLDEAEQLVQHLIDDLSVRDVGVFYQDDPFGKSGLYGTIKTLGKYGIEFKTKGSYARNQPPAEDAYKSFLADKPSAVVLSGLSPATNMFLKKTAEKGYKPIYLGGNPVSSAAFIADATEAKVSYFAATSTPNPDDTSFELIRNFRTDMKASGYPADQNFSVEAYMNATVMVDALKTVGKEITRQGLRDAFEKMDKSIGGVHFKFSKENHKGHPEIFLSKLENGKMVSVKIFTISKP